MLIHPFHPAHSRQALLRLVRCPLKPSPESPEYRSRSQPRPRPQPLSPPLRVRTSNPSSPGFATGTTMTAADGSNAIDPNDSMDRWAQIRRNAAQRAAALQSPISAGGSAPRSPSFERERTRNILPSQRDSWMSDSVRSSFESARTSTAPTKIKRVSVGKDLTVGQPQERKSEEVKENQRPTSGGSETSKEESIEDRVARIKARVAQLTGAAPDAAPQA
ncbi:hypothetical protein KEM56_006222 [Ascosphaera pollenicola]|nr:hypothetical protein KEM56_006222 [Ascosphaera pollenicola]